MEGRKAKSSFSLLFNFFFSQIPVAHAPFPLRKMGMKCAMDTISLVSGGFDTDRAARSVQNLFFARAVVKRPFPQLCHPAASPPIPSRGGG